MAKTDLTTNVIMASVFADLGLGGARLGFNINGIVLGLAFVGGRFAQTAFWVG